MLKAASGGYFLIPTGPSVGTTVQSSASANTYGSWVEMSASAPADLFIVGVRLANFGGVTSYITLDIGTGAGGAESSVGEIPFGGMDPGTDSGLQGFTVMFPFPMPVASGTRIAARVADNVASAINASVTLICINQADVVDIGIAEAVDVTKWNGTAVATPDTAGYPKVTIKDGTGQGELDLDSGGVKLSTAGAAAAADALWDEVIEGAITGRQSARLWNAAAGGKLSGAGTTSVAIRDLGDTKDRVTATVDSNGNRTAVSRDLT